MENTLTEAGLSKLQARAYLYLLEKGPTPPKSLIDKLNTSRTNTYKVLESLEKIGLAKKEVKDKKTVYFPESPTALASLVAEKRNNVIALEQNVSKAMQKLNSSYRLQKNSIRIETFAGQQPIVMAYNKQSEAGQPIYFVKSRADIPFMGFDVMDSVRRKQGKLSQHRYGITPDTAEAPKNSDIDKSANLTRTWIKASDYTAPVEWSVSGDSVLIQVFDGEGKSVVIESGFIAESFRQIWQITNTAIRSNESYKQMPMQAKRKI